MLHILSVPPDVISGEKNGVHFEPECAFDNLAHISSSLLHQSCKEGVPNYSDLYPVVMTVGSSNPYSEVRPESCLVTRYSFTCSQRSKAAAKCQQVAYIHPSLCASVQYLHQITIGFNRFLHSLRWHQMAPLAFFLRPTLNHWFSYMSTFAFRDSIYDPKVAHRKICRLDPR